MSPSKTTFRIWSLKGEPPSWQAIFFLQKDLCICLLLSHSCFCPTPNHLFLVQKIRFWYKTLPIWHLSVYGRWTFRIRGPLIKGLKRCVSFYIHKQDTISSSRHQASRVYYPPAPPLQFLFHCEVTLLGDMLTSNSVTPPCTQLIFSPTKPTPRVCDTHLIYFCMYKYG